MTRAVYKSCSLLMALSLLVPVCATAAEMADIGNTWYSEAVVFMVEHEAISGKTDTAFEPSAPMTRSAMAAALWCIGDHEIPSGEAAC